MKLRFLRPAFLIVCALIAGALTVAAPVSANDVASACAGITVANPNPTNACISFMETKVAPAVTPIPEDKYTLSQYTYYHVITPDAANVYDAPNGGVIRQIEPGFNFVIATDVNSAPGWIGIQGGGWMNASDLKLTPPSYFTGVQLLNRLDQPFGWMMFNLYPAAAPGGKQDYKTNPLYLRFQRFNVFANVTLDGLVWYMIGPNQWVEQRWVAVAKQVARPAEVKGRWVAIDLYEQTLIAYEDDTPVFATLVATGLPNYDTPQGVFKVWARAISDPMSGAAGSPAAYALQSVPWVQYFNDGISLHGTYWHDGFGYRRSHGCVNLSISDARYIYDWTGKNPPDDKGEPTTYVYVYSSGVYGQFGIAQG